MLLLSFHNKLIIENPNNHKFCKAMTKIYGNILIFREEKSYKDSFNVIRHMKCYCRLLQLNPAQ